jgi:hypothetical protein
MLTDLTFPEAVEPAAMPQTFAVAAKIGMRSTVTR